MAGLAAKPARELSPSSIADLPAQLGVYEILDDDGRVLKIGYAGGREPFGMRSALAAELDHVRDAVSFRHEFTHGYLTRWQELLMEHRRDRGSLPPGNHADAEGLGRLSGGRR